MQLIERPRIKAFPAITIAPPARIGYRTLMLLGGLGGLRPNTVVAPLWTDPEEEDDGDGIGIDEAVEDDDDDDDEEGCGDDETRALLSGAAAKRAAAAAAGAGRRRRRGGPRRRRGLLAPTVQPQFSTRRRNAVYNFARSERL